MINEKMFALGNQGSAIRELFEYGKKRKAEIGEDNVFDFSLGNPNVPCPDKVTKSLVEIIGTTDPVALHGYSSSAGHYEVRAAISEYLNKTYFTEESPDCIYLTPGAAAAITISLHALLCDDDEVIVFTPFFPEYRVFVEKAGGKLVCVPSDSDLLPDFNALSDAITEKTKVVIINSPNNPTGVMYGEDVIKKIALLLEEKQNKYGNEIYLLSDEPYRELIYSDKKYPFITKYYKNSIVTYSFSKSLSLPGERIGYVLVGHGCSEKTKVFKAVCGAGRALGFVCESTLFQKLIPYCLGEISDISVYSENRDILYNHLAKIGYNMVMPEGAFYLFMKALEPDDRHFAEVAKKFELLLVPSHSFGVDGYVRISYCVSKQQILNSLNAFEKLKEYYDKGC